MSVDSGRDESFRRSLEVIWDGVGVGDIVEDFQEGIFRDDVEEAVAGQDEEVVVRVAEAIIDDIRGN